MKLKIVALLIIVAFASCKKDARIFTVKGKIYNPQMETYVEGVEVKLLGSVVESGIYNDNYITLNSDITNANGEYSMEIEEQKVSGYRFLISKENYFVIEEDITTDKIESSDEFNKNFNLYPIAEIQLNVQNTQPFNSDDEIRYRFLNIESSCRECCNNSFVIGSGPLYNESKTCELRGNKALKLEWIVFKAGGTNTYHDTIYCEAFKTTTFDINY